MLHGRNLTAIAVIVALITGDLVLVRASHGNGDLLSSWPALWPYLLVWAAITALTVYAVLKNDQTSH